VDMARTNEQMLGYLKFRDAGACMSNPNSLLEEMRSVALGDGPYAGWRLSKTPEQLGVNKKTAYESISVHQATLGHALQAIRGDQFEEAKQILLHLRESVEASLQALGEGKPITGAR